MGDAEAAGAGAGALFASGDIKGALAGLQQVKKQRENGALPVSRLLALPLQALPLRSLSTRRGTSARSSPAAIGCCCACMPYNSARAVPVPCADKLCAVVWTQVAHRCATATDADRLLLASGCA